MSQTNTANWRSILFVPATSERFINSALKQKADVLQIDLEDSVVAQDKAFAREQVPVIAKKFVDAGFDVSVRINRPWRMTVKDLEHAVCEHVTAICLPKVPHAHYIHSIAEILLELETEQGLAPGHTKIIAMIEDPEGLVNVNEIAVAHPRVCGLIVGAEDLAVSLHSAVTYDVLYMPNMQALIACRKAGIKPIGFIGSVADFKDEAEFRKKIIHAKTLGFEAAFCIHPKQVDIVNEVMLPSVQEIEYAQQMVEEYEHQKRLGKGAFTFRGRMVDLPVILQQQQVLEKARAYQ